MECRLGRLRAQPRRVVDTGPESGWLSLTDTESRVVAEVVKGPTNVQADKRLFLSRYAVEFHLRQVFRKLGIHSRGELIRVSRQSADEPPGEAMESTQIATMRQDDDGT